MGAAIQPQPFGKYFLLEKIASGGMAEIFKAMYRAGGDFEKTLVIKRILPHLAGDDEFVAMFRDEAKLTVRLNHANIVQVFDFGRHGDDHFLAMEYVQGQNLRQVMRRCQELGATVPIPFALYVCMEVCKGLQYAHTRKDENDRAMGIIHRDITPSNILLSYEGEVKIADFGIAKAASRSAGTQAGMIKGKASYLSPEQIRGKEEIDHRADVFSLGAVLWELLVGRKLFSGENDFDIMNKLLEQPIPPPSKMNSTVPPRIDLVVMMALDRDRTKRYPNAASLQKDLARLLEEFGGTVATVDVAKFLRRLFQKEIEAEKEASKSLRRMVVDEAKVASAAGDGATIAAGTAVDRDTAPPMPAARRPAAGASPIVLGGALAAIGVFALGGGLALSGVFGEAATPTPTPEPTIAVAPSPTPAPSAEASPAESALIAFPDSTPVELPSGAPETPAPTPAPVASTAPSPARTKVAMKTPVPGPTKAPVSGKLGELKLDSQPWGEIFIDGKSIGRQTPAFDLKVPVGKHQIRLVNDVQKLEASFEVEIVEGAPVKKVVKLQPMTK